MPSATLETVLLTRDEALFTACRLRFAESGVGLTLARNQAEFRAAMREKGAGVVVLDGAHTDAVLGLGAEEAVAKLSPLLASRVIVVLAEAGAAPERVVRLLELGAHDVVQKPVRPRILAEQLKALVRVFARGGRPARGISAAPGDSLVMDYPRRRCYIKEEGGSRRELKFTRAEFSVLHLLLQKKGAVATYSDFRDALWPDSGSYREITHILHQLVTNIRKKIAASEARIENLRAEGFRLVQQ
ncbi:MAG: hypothetical protein CVU79_05930 [Elusimicrobia bacterium HGW-Elusimicrobia-3]|nr:MAG: hypothetical protein CVU79_05930 [Elusimicrobia bacterium HGW-Elusimicrobia-3]